MPSSKGRSATKRGGKTPPTGTRRSLRNAGRNHDNSKNLNNSKIGTALTTGSDNGKGGGGPPPATASPSPVAVDDIGRADRARRGDGASPKGSPLLEGPKARPPGPRGPANQLARGAPPAPEPEPSTPEPPRRDAQPAETGTKDGPGDKKPSSTPVGDRLEQFQVEETLRRSVQEAAAMNTRNPQDAPVVAKDEKPSDQDLAREASAAVHQVEDGLRDGNHREGGGFGQVLRGQFDQAPGVPQRVGLPATETGYYPVQPAPEPVIQGLPGQTAAPCRATSGSL